MFESWLIRVRLVSLVGLKFRRVLFTTLGVLDGILIGTFVGIYIRRC